MHPLTATASSSLSLSPGNYIYAITSTSSGSLAAISSDDSLRVFDAASLDRVTVLAAQTHGAGGVTALRTYGAGKDQQLLVTGGRDGKVKVWDARKGRGAAVVEMETVRNAPVLSVACCSGTNTVVAGTELVSSQAVVAFWDIRSPGTHRLQYIESHNDDVTDLQYHPTRDNILLSGSTDGLVNIYDTTITDEDDALVQVINHGSVHHAGFLSERTIFALSHDEDFSVHPATDPDQQTAEPKPIHFGDLREPLGCEYIAQVCVSSQGAYIAAGNKLYISTPPRQPIALAANPSSISSGNRLDLVPLIPDPWRLDQANLWRLPGAHGEEVVRSIYLDEQGRTVFTGGEDGFVRAWKPEDGGDGLSDSTSVKASRPKEKKREKERFKPY
ncbi:WD repeat protein [Aspergillus clavatus NRRL 1]|uniref:WD domain protein n=1 Tax=Aspergillus clavatus (strain ATCC 1007 / CBS 513.65 / DSM 816 / NCTC 3887 / NRRL 1 / QM 1276 / 107) TaxID=344612 RepID=A1CNZ9_ASPCL|nr:WD domain protein [Aspergillus clavatus NRRL 1]EAW07370.1 WD domain protein [Aspergillus clavatus NRRL 1]